MGSLTVSSCPWCHTPYRDGASYCGTCGTATADKLKATFGNQPKHYGATNSYAGEPAALSLEFPYEVTDRQLKEIADSLRNESTVMIPRINVALQNDAAMANAIREIRGDLVRQIGMSRDETRFLANTSVAYATYPAAAKARETYGFSVCGHLPTTKSRVMEQDILVTANQLQKDVAEFIQKATREGVMAIDISHAVIIVPAFLLIAARLAFRDAADWPSCGTTTNIGPIMVRKVVATNHPSDRETGYWISVDGCIGQIVSEALKEETKVPPRDFDALALIMQIIAILIIPVALVALAIFLLSGFFK